MSTKKTTTHWRVEPNFMPGVHRIRATVRRMYGPWIASNTVSHCVHQSLLDSAIEPMRLVGLIISDMQQQLHEIEDSYDY